MNKKSLFKKNVILIIFFILQLSTFNFAKIEYQKFDEIEKEVQVMMDKGKIPGLCMVIIDGKGIVMIKGLGYADIEQKTPVTSNTLFELASCSKAFTALAALQLEEKSQINLNDHVSKYLPWFFVKYKNQKPEISIYQLLHHTSGIPWETISNIPQGNNNNALEQTVRNIVGIELNNIPGKQFEYATINYDIIGLIIEKVTGNTFEDYMDKKLFKPLGLNNTTVGVEKDTPRMASGYKIGFFSPRKYHAPVFKGNNPAGYIISNGKDIAAWLKIQMGLERNEWNSIIEKSHLPDMTVLPNNNQSYAMGWYVNQYENKEISHTGSNPNFSVYIGFRPEDKKGVAVLANSNSNHTPLIAKKIMKMLTGEKYKAVFDPDSSGDRAFSVISIFVGISLLGVIALIIFAIIHIFKGKRQFEKITWKKVYKLFTTLLLFMPFLFGIYLIPDALFRVSWETAVVWAPISFNGAISLFIALMGMSYILLALSLLFPYRDKYLRSFPIVIPLTMLAGVANMTVILIIINSVRIGSKLGYLLYFFGLAFLLYIFGNRVVRTKIIRITLDVVYDIRLKLLRKIFSTSYQKFERIDRGRVYATLNDDTNQIAAGIGVFVTLASNLITVFGVFIYLGTIALWATLLTFAVVLMLATLYQVVSVRVSVFFEKARDTNNVYMRLINGLLDGFKELSMHFNRKTEFIDDLRDTGAELVDKAGKAQVKFVDAFLVGETLLISVLASVSFLFPRIFPGIRFYVLISFIMIVLYLIGPINSILNSAPAIMRIKVAWGRVNRFIDDINPDIDFENLKEFDYHNTVVEKLELKGVEFEYRNGNDMKNFKVGPIDLETKKGEITFIIGGNGSGKTTIAKLITGLYTPDKGNITINGNGMKRDQLGEFFSVVFSDYHLFEKLYDIDLKSKVAETKKYLDILRLTDKVELKDNSFSTIDLSGGQRKRLALLQCYLEDRPIYLFDEVAADQDPEFRKFFYRVLLKRMKDEGRIVIVITHDDHYFDVADKIVKMDMGKIDALETGAQYRFIGNR